jgi:anaerobic dimethyl sulfoxide reductase subunit B (iron-sulfur subunit)
MVQYGFFFDQSRCVGCRACTIACNDWNNLPSGPVKWAPIYEWEKGGFPNLRLHYLFAPCYHCQNPVCVDAANGAMYKEAKYGAVLIDPDKATSPSLRAAWQACPYGAIQFESDALDAKASHCTMCIDRLEQGRMPACAEACPMRALDFGPLDTLSAKYGTTRDLEDMPSSTTTLPAVIFKPQRIKKPEALVPYPADQALTLLAQRPSPLPPVITDTKLVTQIPPGLVGRDQLVMKSKNVQEFMYRTRHDEG